MSLNDQLKSALNDFGYSGSLNDAASGFLSGTVPSQLKDMVTGAGIRILLGASSIPVRVIGSSTGAIMGQAVIKAGSVLPGSVLTLNALCGKVNNLGGVSITAYLGGVAIAQSSLQAGVYGMNGIATFFVSGDLQSLTSYSAFWNDVNSTPAGGGAPYAAHTTTAAVASVDMTVDQTLTIKMSAANGDTIELIGWSLAMDVPPAYSTQSYAPENATACWGDSLTAGTGAVSPSGGWPSQLLAARVGQSIISLGIGGQTSTQITTRVLADKMRGRLWNCIFWMGRNDVGSANLSTVVMGNLASCVANLSGAAKYLVGTVINAANEGIGSGNWNAIVALNASIKATYGAKVADIHGALTSNGTAQIPIAYRAAVATTTATGTSGATTMTVGSATGIVNGQYVSGAGIPDQTTITISGTTVTLSRALTGNLSSTAVQFVGPTEVHLNDAGYAVVKATIDAAMTANGM